MHTTPQPTTPGRRKTLTGIGALIAMLTVLGTATGCETDSGTSASPDTAASAPAEEKPKPAKENAEKQSGDNAAAEQASLPNLVGKGLQDAQDTAQAAGFYVLRSNDATGRGRFQVFDRNWIVCSQTPAAGTHPTDTEVKFSTVKDSETCP